MYFVSFNLQLFNIDFYIPYTINITLKNTLFMDEKLI